MASIICIMWFCGRIQPIANFLPKYKLVEICHVDCRENIKASKNLNNMKTVNNVYNTESKTITWKGQKQKNKGSVVKECIGIHTTAIAHPDFS